MRAITLLLSLLGLIAWTSPSSSQTTSDWITGAPREAMPIKAWPDGKKVAICFVLYVEVWGKGQGPNFRPDMTAAIPTWSTRRSGNTPSNGACRASAACSGTRACRSASR